MAFLGIGLTTPWGLEGVFGVGAAVAALFKRTFSTSASLGDDATFARSSTGTVVDHEDIVRTIPANGARFSGLRVVRNLVVASEDFSTAAGWAHTNTPTLTTGITDPNGGTRATRFEAGAAFARIRNNHINGSSATGRNFVNSVWVRRVSGTGPVNLYEPDATAINISSALSSSWQRLSVSSAGGASNTQFSIQLNTSGDVVEIYGGMAEETTGSASPTLCGEYTSVGVESDPWHGAGIDGLQYFATENGNTVTSNVVDETGTGAAITGGSLLMEPAATNLLSYSEELDQTEWLKTNAAQLPNSAISPDGTATADKLYEDNTTDYHTANQFGITVTSGVDYALSVYAKYAGDGVHLQIRVHGQGAGVAWCNFDLDNGITGNSGGTHLISQSIESVGDGWYRCVAIVQYPSGGSDEGLQLVLCQTPSTDSEIPTYLGDASSGIYVWGMQMEVGSVPTSYIYTGSGSATRTAETLQYPLTTPQTEGMAVVVLGGFSTTAPGTQGIVGFTAASTTSLAYRTSAATPVYASDGTNVSDTGAIANGSAVEAIAVRWGSATHTVGYRTSTGWTWDATPATYDGAWTSDNTLQVLKSLGEPYNLSTVAIYESDEGTSWIESEYPT